MKYYLINPVLEEIEKEIIALYETEKLSREQALRVLNIVKNSMEQYNSKYSRQFVRRCGKCLKVLEDAEPIYSLEKEINKIAGGTWWEENLDYDIVCDTLCQRCYESILQKYFSKNG